jgi:hypothetical protein
MLESAKLNHSILESMLVELSTRPARYQQSQLLISQHTQARDEIVRKLLLAKIEINVLAEALQATIVQQGTIK